MIEIGFFRKDRKIAGALFNFVESARWKSDIESVLRLDMSSVYLMEFQGRPCFVATDGKRLHIANLDSLNLNLEDVNLNKKSYKVVSFYKDRFYVLEAECDYLLLKIKALLLDVPSKEGAFTFFYPLEKGKTRAMLEFIQKVNSFIGQTGNNYTVDYSLLKPLAGFNWTIFKIPGRGEPLYFNREDMTAIVYTQKLDHSNSVEISTAPCLPFFKKKDFKKGDAK